ALPISSVVVTLTPTIGSLTITVFGPGGPIQAATVELTSGRPGQIMPGAMDTGADGSATFPNIDTGTYTYQVSASGYNLATNKATVKVGQTVSTKVTLTPTPSTGNLKVTVSGPTGSLQGATVTITSGPSGQTLPSAETTGADG